MWITAKETREKKKRKKKEEKKNKGKLEKNQRKKIKVNQGRNPRAAKGRGSRQPRRGKEREEAAMEGGESGGAATVRSHGPPPSPLSRFSNGKLPI